MSHFSVAVITRGEETIDELLAPYDEGLRVVPYISKTKVEVIADGKKSLQSYLENPDGEWKYRYKDTFAQFLNAESDEDFYKAECEYCGYQSIDKDGNVLSTYNPNSKWDWYVIGGRWTGTLPVNNETLYVAQDTAMLKDIDFTPDPKSMRRYKRIWEVVVEGSPLLPGENQIDFFSMYSPEYYKKRYGDAETYAKANSRFSCFAILDANGVWYETGSMGWFGISSNTPEEGHDWDENFESLLKKLAGPDDWVTVVDCHI